MGVLVYARKEHQMPIDLSHLPETGLMQSTEIDHATRPIEELTAIKARMYGELARLEEFVEECQGYHRWLMDKGIPVAAGHANYLERAASMTVKTMTYELELVRAIINDRVTRLQAGSMAMNLATIARELTEENLPIDEATRRVRLVIDEQEPF